MAALLYCAVVLWSAWDFARRKRDVPENFAPPVSVLKPLKGLDPGMYEAFVSHCRQDYAGEVELLFGVSSMDDPTVEAVRRLQSEFPEQSIHLVLCPEHLGINGKINTVVQLARAARHDYLVLTDSDIRVSPHYLNRVIGGFAAPERGKPVGLVTAPYRGRAFGTLGSRLEALGIATDFFPGVLAALKLDGGARFGLGSTLAVSRAALSAAGGFESVVDALADDYQLGLRITDAGYSVAVSHEVVETAVEPYKFGEFFAHQLRWARGIRDSRHTGYLGLIFTFALPWAVFNTIASGGSTPSLVLLAFAIAARVLVALTVGIGLLGDRQVLRDFWLLPLRDFCALWIWVWSFASNTVEWRGKEYQLKNGRLESCTPGPSQAEDVDSRRPSSTSRIS